jgi:uncharacterized protein YaeQ
MIAPSSSACFRLRMALGSTLYHVKIALSDVDRGVYEALDFRMAMHPSESPRYLATRMLAYALSYEDGIAFSKGGISSTDEPAVLVRDPTGVLVSWIEVGAPSAERLHKAAKAARRVALFTSGPLAPLQEQARSGVIHRASSIAVWQFDPSFLDGVAERMERNVELELVHTDGQLYVTLRGQVLNGNVERAPLGPA